MNWKIALTAALLISGGSFTTQAQQKTAVAQAKVNTEAKAFLAKVSEFEKGDATTSAAALETLKTKMMAGIGSSKDQMGEAQVKGDNAAASKLMEKHQTRADVFNRLVQLSKSTPMDKSAMVFLMQQYAKTL
jgi:hypothetical protein